MSMNAIECALLLSNLSRTREWLLPGERMPFHQYWQYCLGSFIDEASGILRTSQVVIWVDGQPVLDHSSHVPVTYGSQFALTRGHRTITEVLPHGAWWN